MALRNYDKEANDTKDHKYSYDFDTSLRSYMWRKFQPWIRTGSALELGCFEGDFTVLLEKQYRRLTVIEAAKTLIDVTQKRVGTDVEFVHSTFEEAKLNHEYDDIFLIHTMEHLDDPVSVMKRIAGWLKPDGRLFVAVPNADAASRQIAVEMGLITHNTAITPSEAEHGHRITYCLDTLSRDIRASGLNILERGGIMFKPLANFQFDQILQAGLLQKEYLEGCFRLGDRYPELCASIFAICTK